MQFNKSTGAVQLKYWCQTNKKQQLISYSSTVHQFHRWNKYRESEENWEIDPKLPPGKTW